MKSCQGYEAYDLGFKGNRVGQKKVYDLDFGVYPKPKS